MDKFARWTRRPGGRVYDGQFTRPPHVVSNGPYRAEALGLQDPPACWRRTRTTGTRDNVKCKSIEMAVVEDALTQLLRYESGSVDWVASVPTEIAAEMKQKGRPDLQVVRRVRHDRSSRSWSARSSTTARTTRWPTCASARRCAWRSTRSRSSRRSRAWAKRPRRTFVPPGVFDGYQKMQGIPLRPRRAKQLLAEAGYAERRHAARASATSSAATSRRRASWRRSWRGSGSRCSTSTSRWKPPSEDPSASASTTATTRSAPPTGIGDYGDPSTFTDKYRSNSENNDSVWVNPKYDALSSPRRRSRTSTKRLRLLEQAEQVLLERRADLPALPPDEPVPLPRRRQGHQHQPAEHDDVQGRGGRREGGSEPARSLGRAIVCAT